MTAKPVGPYTPAVRAGDWLIVSGQVGLADGKLVGGGLEAQLRQALANLRGHLEANGATMAHVAKTTVFLIHMSDYALMNEIYVDAFGDHRPARSAVAVAELPIGALVEVEAWAYLGKNVDVIGVVIIVFVLVIVLPVSFLVGGAAVAAILSSSLKSNAEATHAGSELIDLNR